jgi:uncharacterized protein involved in outer membrane biogenesis
MRPLRRSLAWAGGVLGLLMFGVLACEAAGWPFLRLPLQNAMQRATGVPVALDGSFRTHLLWRPRLSAEHLNIGAGAGVSAPHLLDARQLHLGWRWADLWRWRQGGELRLRELRAAVLDAHLLRDAQGRASWQLGAPDPEVGTAQETQRSAQVLPRLERLLVEQGLIVIDDGPLDTELRIEVQGGEAGSGDPAATAVAPLGSGASPAANPGAGARASPMRPSGYRASVKGRYQALPLDLQLHSGGLLPLVEDAQTGSTPLVALRVEGRAGAAVVFFDGQAGALMGQPRLQGAFRMGGPSLGRVAEPLGVTLPQTPAFDLRGQLEHEAGVWQIHADQATIGSSRLRGDFRYDTRQQPPQLSGSLSGSRLALADLGPAVGVPEAAPSGANTAAAAAGRPRPDRVLPQREFDLPSLRHMNADVQVAIAELDFGGDSVASMGQLVTHLLLERGVLRLRDLGAEVAGGRLAGSMRLDSTADAARWAVDLRLDGVDLAGWLPALRTDVGEAAQRTDRPAGARDTTAPRPQRLRKDRKQARQGGDQPVQAYVTGTLNAGIRATGAGRSTAQILGSLNGQADLLLSEGTLSHLATEVLGLDVAQALGVLVRGDRPLPLRCARVELSVRNGLVQTRQAVLDNADSTVRVAAQLNLRDESIALRAVARPKDVSLLSLRAPVTVSGTLANPQLGIDGKRLAGRLLGAAALAAAVGPLAALLPLVDPGDRGAGDPCGGRPGSSPESPTRSAAPAGPER